MAATFSKEERAAMRAAAAEAKAAKAGADMTAACDAAIAEMAGKDRELATIVHRIVLTNTALTPRTWYGMPAYSNADGKTVVFFQSASKFRVRYATLGFQPAAQLDDGNYWPTSFALIDVSPADEEQLVELIRQAAG